MEDLRRFLSIFINYSVENLELNGRSSQTLQHFVDPELQFGATKDRSWTSDSEHRRPRIDITLCALPAFPFSFPSTSVAA